MGTDPASVSQTDQSQHCVSARSVCWQVTHTKIATAPVQKRPQSALPTHVLGHKTRAWPTDARWPHRVLCLHFCCAPVPLGLTRNRLDPTFEEQRRCTSQSIRSSEGPSSSQLLSCRTAEGQPWLAGPVLTAPQVCAHLVLVPFSQPVPICKSEQGAAVAIRLLVWSARTSRPPSFTLPPTTQSQNEQKQ